MLSVISHISDFSPIAKFLAVVVFIVMAVASVYARLDAEKEYEKLKRLGAQLPPVDSLGDGPFIHKFSASKSRHKFYRLIAICAVLLVLIGIGDLLFRSWSDQ